MLLNNIAPINLILKNICAKLKPGDIQHKILKQLHCEFEVFQNNIRYRVIDTYIIDRYYNKHPYMY